MSRFYIHEQLLKCLIYNLLVASALAAPGKPENVVQETIQQVQGTFEDVFESVENIIDRSTIAGQISPILSRLILTREQLRTIWEGMTQVVSFSDIIFLAILSFALVPTMKVPYRRLHPTAIHLSRSRDSRKIRPPEYRRPILYHVAHTISQVARLAFVVYAFDMVKIFLLGAGFAIPRGERLTHAFAYILYTVYATHRISRLKKYLLKQSVPSWSGRIQVLNRLGNAVLVGVSSLIILDILNVEMGLALQGVVALGSVGTLVISLAAKDTVANLLHGLILSAPDRIYEGDKIRLDKNGFSGSVHKPGWLETILRGSDEIMVTIPNADLLGQRVCNLSRIHQCQVKQTLQFQYADCDKLPQVIEDIKKEIRSSCPAVITDGSRPFRCYWTSYEASHLAVTLDAHFRIRPIGDAYYENRMRVLQAINRAVRKNGMAFKAG